MGVKSFIYFPLNSRAHRRYVRNAQAAARRHGGFRLRRGISLFPAFLEKARAPLKSLNSLQHPQLVKMCSPQHIEIYIYREREKQIK